MFPPLTSSGNSFVSEPKSFIQYRVHTVPERSTPFWLRASTNIIFSAKFSPSTAISLSAFDMFTFLFSISIRFISAPHSKAGRQNAAPSVYSRNITIPVPAAPATTDSVAPDKRMGNVVAPASSFQELVVVAATPFFSLKYNGSDAWLFCIIKQRPFTATSCAVVLVVSCFISAMLYGAIDTIPFIIASYSASVVRIIAVALVVIQVTVSPAAILTPSVDATFLTSSSFAPLFEM